ncbi:M23 family metallopeptidase [Deinococcus hopiensis]|uniref:Membrane proteins related to metalloendopeptidases n=1 Tax=Deinococcus hopiensis KR-140 TaxID=695939 RepID=A0A1W1UXH3_9DEIO|nr:M23 family metallopeptidase [Deinococcus hopiensis]SMB85710.1 Membrane proteins related to metalloendopeptidases [Deinococcus hopiensis KR-140]
MTLLLVGCMQPPTPTVTPPTPSTGKSTPGRPDLATNGRLYQLSVKDSGKQNITATAQEISSGLATQALVDTTAPLAISAPVSVLTFTNTTARTRHIRATFTVTNQSSSTLTKLTFLPVDTNDVDSDPTNNASPPTTGDTPFREVKHYDGSDASSQATLLEASRGKIFNAGSGNTEIDPLTNTFQSGLNIASLFPTPPAGLSVTVKNYGWAVTPSLAPGQSSNITFAFDINNIDPANPEADPYSFNLIFTAAEENVGASNTISPSGGTIQLRDIADITFPTDSLTKTQSVEVQRIQDPQIKESFATSVAGQKVEFLADYQVRIVASEQPVKPIHVSLKIPSSLNIIPGVTPVMFGWPEESENEGEGGVLDIFRPLYSKYDKTTRELTADLPSWVFTSGRREDGRMEAIVSLALAPEAPSLSAQTILETCDMEEVESPLPGKPLTISSPYGGRLVEGSEFHHGLDIATPVGTAVYSSTDGIVGYIDFQESSKPGLNKKKQPIIKWRGAGQFITIWSVSGKYAVYMHLTKDSVQKKVGDVVKRGDLIGYSGDTGAAKGAPHLHIEYRNEMTDRAAGTFDPLPCLKPVEIKVSTRELSGGAIGTVQMSGTVNNINDDGNYRKRLIWSIVDNKGKEVTGSANGVIDRITGLYTPPSTLGKYIIRATLQLDVNRDPNAADPDAPWVMQDKMYKDTEIRVGTCPSFYGDNLVIFPPTKLCLSGSVVAKRPTKDGRQLCTFETTLKVSVDALVDRARSRADLKVKHSAEHVADYPQSCSNYSTPEFKFETNGFILQPATSLLYGFSTSSSVGRGDMIYINGTGKEKQLKLDYAWNFAEFANMTRVEITLNELSSGN